MFNSNKFISYITSTVKDTLYPMWVSWIPASELHHLFLFSYYWIFPHKSHFFCFLRKLLSKTTFLCLFFKLNTPLCKSSPVRCIIKISSARKILFSLCCCESRIQQSTLCFHLLKISSKLIIKSDGKYSSRVSLLYLF